MAMRFCAVLLTVHIAFAQGVSPTRPTPPPQFPRRIILDTDPGIDDAMAVLLALRSPELKVEAITTVAGNVPVELGTENARKLAELAGRTDVIVAKGAARPLQRKLITAELIHGENGLGGVVLPTPKVGLDHRHAVQVIRDLIEANPGQITLVPVGPLTNIAMSFLQCPDLPAKTREIIMVGWNGRSRACHACGGTEHLPRCRSRKGGVWFGCPNPDGGSYGVRSGALHAKGRGTTTREH